jgi:hypothetical protein
MAFFVTAMMFSASANAQIVYTDVNPDTTVTCSTYPCNKSYNLDLNNDGTVDFTLYSIFDSLHCTPSIFSPNVIKQQVYVTSQSGNGTFSLMNSAIMMNASDTISSNLGFSPNPGMLRSVQFDSCGLGSYGNWTSTSDHFLGLQMTVGANTYYGWARLNVDVPGSTSPVYFTLKDYAYNNVLNQPILAGQTTTTGISPLSFGAGSGVRLFPNPAKDKLTIDLATSINEVEVTIADITGKIIYKTTALNAQKVDVNTQDFAAGIYAVQILTTDFIATRKLVIKK